MREWTAGSRDNNLVSDSICVLKVEPTGYHDKFSVKCEREKEPSWIQGFWQINCNHRFFMKLYVQEYEVNNFEGGGRLLMLYDGNKW